MANPLIGLRLRALREERDLNQDAVAKLLGFRDRQTVSAIENGDRRAKPEELSRLIDHFKLDPDFFTDPFRLVGEGQFSWRHSQCAPAALTAYQERAGRWLAAYRALSSPDERPGPREGRTLRLWENSSFELACAEGERFTVDYAMGDVPARRLPQVMEDDFGILVLMVDMDEGISGAACRLPEMDAVLVNRRENPGRRNFDLAHEFFHILTWDKMPPRRVELANERGGSRVEQLANNFASALLMPRRLLERFGEWRRLGDAERASRMRTVADHFQVSVSALHWRLVALKFLGAAAQMLDVAAPSSSSVRDTPARFSRAFMTVFAAAIDAGRVSASRAAKLLECSRDGLRELFQQHQVAAPVTV
ncbi:MAG: XRE family transcriptional regulator [Pseudomonadota bacterium]|nr:XRE family transcriptional regulator [Pseudomonadota bacterium]